MNEYNEFYKVLREIKREMEGRVIGRPGYAPVGRVTRVDEQGAHLEGPGNFRVDINGLWAYHALKG